MEKNYIFILYYIRWAWLSFKFFHFQNKIGNLCGACVVVCKKQTKNTENEGVHSFSCIGLWALLLCLLTRLGYFQVLLQLCRRIFIPNLKLTRNLCTLWGSSSLFLRFIKALKKKFMNLWIMSKEQTFYFFGKAEVLLGRVVLWVCPSTDSAHFQYLLARKNFQCFCQVWSWLLHIYDQENV